MSEATSSQRVNGNNSPHIEQLDIYSLSDDRCTHINTHAPTKECREPFYQHGDGKPEPIRGAHVDKGNHADQRGNCDPTEHYDPCMPYTGCADIVPSIGCGRKDRIPGDARPFELNLEEAERFMPQPTTKAPWFGYESYEDYGDEGLDAVADNDADTKSRGDRAGPAKASSASEGSERATEGKSRVDGAVSAASPDPSGGEGTTGMTKAPGCSGPDTITAGIEVDVKIVKLKVDATWDGSDSNDGSSPGHDRGNKP